MKLRRLKIKKVPAFVLQKPFQTFYLRKILSFHLALALFAGEVVTTLGAFLEIS